MARLDACLNTNQKKRNKNINISCLWMYIHNNHCYEINVDVKNFEQVVWKNDQNINNDRNIDTEMTSISVSNKYNVRSQTTDKDTPIFWKQ